MSYLRSLSLFSVLGRPDRPVRGGTVPFEAELYVHAPERFGRWHDAGPRSPTRPPPALTEEQLRGELALLILRWTCLGALAVGTLGLLFVFWRVALR